MTTALRNFSLRLLVSVAVFGVVVFLAVYSADESIWPLFKSLSPVVLAAVFLSLVFNLLMAALRFGVVSSYYGAAVRPREAIAIVSASNVAGAFFFQIAGQLMARGAMMARLGIGSFSGAVIVTTHERIAAALVSLLGAALGAFVVFGAIYFDVGAGAGDLVKLAVTGFLATVLGVALSGAAPFILPDLNLRTIGLWTMSFLLSVGVQVPMMIAYVVAAKALAPGVPTLSIFAATLVVMFAASVPISFAGWGVRELSAVAALGAIGLSSSKAFLVAVMVGIGSMLVAGLGAAATLPSLFLKTTRRKIHDPVERRNYTRVLFVAVPVLAAIAVVFQVYLPVKGSLVNVNLADPLALAGGALFLARCFLLREAPRWRYPHVILAVLVVTFVMTVSLFIGATRFGFTGWALTNRYLGWFVLIAYAATGALIAAEKSLNGVMIISKAYLAAVTVVAGTEILIFTVNFFYVIDPTLAASGTVDGMAQNRNAFAFQLLMALGLGIGFRLYRRRVFTAALAFIAVALALTFSRSGLITFVAVATVLLLIGVRYAYVIAASGVVCLAVTAVAYMILGSGALLSQLTIDPQNLSERMITLKGGVEIFLAHPLFGGGLGAFRNAGRLSLGGEPLVIHSTFVWLLAETGIAGFAVFTLSIGYVLKREMATIRSDRVSASIVLLLTVIVIMGLPADMLYQRTFWLFVGALVAIPLAGAAAERCGSASGTVSFLK